MRRSGLCARISAGSLRGSPGAVLLWNVCIGRLCRDFPGLQGTFEFADWSRHRRFVHSERGPHACDLNAARAKARPGHTPGCALPYVGLCGVLCRACVGAPTHICRHRPVRSRERHVARDSALFVAAGDGVQPNWHAHQLWACTRDGVGELRRRRRGAQQAGRAVVSRGPRRPVCSVGRCAAGGARVHAHVRGASQGGSGAGGRAPFPSRPNAGFHGESAGGM